MFEKNKLELDQLMTSYGAGLEDFSVKKKTENEQKEIFLKDFEKLKHDVIWPVIVDVGNQLNQYGHDYHVSEDTESFDATAKYYPSNITLNIYPATAERILYQPENTPYISFAADPYARKVSIMVSTVMPNRSGLIGSHGSFDLAQLTAEFAESEIVNVIKNTLIFSQDKQVETNKE
jgi:hypothetical protein